MVEILILVLSGLCCLSALVGLVVGVLVIRQRGAQSGSSTEKAGASAPLMPAATARLDEDPPTRPTELDPRRAAAREADYVEDYDDEDAPTTLIDPQHLGMAPLSLHGGPRRGRTTEQPPPLPSSYSGKPPSHRRAQLDRVKMPDRKSLESGGTIIPPEDWSSGQDYIADEEADETMLMSRPPLPPKK